MTSFNIPWKFLDLSPEPKTSIIEPPKPQKSFAQALTNLCDIPLSQFQQPVVKGDRLAIEIPEAAYEAGLEACKHNLHGRILWPKGSTPLSVVALKAKLALIWKDMSNWGIISLGKGYFEFTFSSLADVRRVRSIPSWNLNPGILKFFAWTKDFNPKMQHNTSAQVWIKIFGLSQEYWHKTILFTIAGSLGTPICIDSITAKPMHERTFGQFARVLVEIDLMQPIRYKLLVERKGFAFFVDLEYEHIPAFCTECKMIGHDFENCRKWNMDAGLRHNKGIHMKQKASESKQAYVPITEGRQQEQSNERVEKEVINVEESVSAPAVVERNMVEQLGNVTDPIIHANQEGVVPAVVERNVVEQLVPEPVIPVHHENSILSPVSARELARVQDEQLEKELNADSDGNWSTDSQDSFVDTTQFNEQLAADTICNNNNEIVTPDNPIIGGDASNIGMLPDRVTRDMEFLKESWANMTEADDEALQNADSNEQGFQLHLTKNQKKAQKKLKQSSRDSYATRSKVPPKPFR
jgi:hypothetical protein